MRSLSLYIVSALTLISLTTQAQMAFPKGTPCNFLCQEIPNANEVLKDWSKPSQKFLVSPTLKVLAWNIYKGRKEFFARDFQQLTKNVDIVMLSEGTDGVLVKPSLDLLLGYQWVMGIAFWMKEKVGTGIITGSYAQTLGASYERTQDDEPFVKSPKVTLLTKYIHGPTRQEILVINIHGINWVNSQAFERQIRSVEPYIKAHTGPIIYAGDFNVRRNTDRLAIINKVVGPYGLKRVPWTNGNSEKQLDDAFTRGFQVRKAAFNYNVVDRSSDHPAMDLELTPIPARFQNRFFH